MIFSNTTIDQIKKKSGLSFDRVSDFSTLATLIGEETKSTIGATTLKRLFGYIEDARETNQSTLNIIARYLNFESWDEYVNSFRMDSMWNENTDTIWTANLVVGAIIDVAYLNRTVKFEVVNTPEGKALRVVDAKNSSLQNDDIAYIDRLRKGERLEARKVCRGASSGSYRTNGEIRTIIVSSVSTTI